MGRTGRRRHSLQGGVQPPTPAELRAFCRASLAHYKTPAEWFFVDAHPTTASGKVQKFEILRRIKDGELTAAPLEERPAP